MLVQDEDFRVTLPVGTSGEWSIDRFDLTLDEAAAHKHGPDGPLHVPAGTYTRLIGPMAIGGSFGYSVWMSDVPHEIEGHREIVRQAHGYVLITGLGLGMVVQACLRKPEVLHVTVVESDRSVIDLVAPHYLREFGQRLEIVHADAFKWLPRRNVPPWDVIWHDIWPSIDPENLPGMARLRRKYARRCYSWQGCWEESTCRAMRVLRRHKAKAAKAGQLLEDGSLSPVAWIGVKAEIERQFQQHAATMATEGGSSAELAKAVEIASK